MTVVLLLLHARYRGGFEREHISWSGRHALLSVRAVSHTQTGAGGRLILGALCSVYARARRGAPARGVMAPRCARNFLRRAFPCAAAHPTLRHELEGGGKVGECRLARRPPAAS